MRIKASWFNSRLGGKRTDYIHVSSSLLMHFLLVKYKPKPSEFNATKQEGMAAVKFYKTSIRPKYGSTAYRSVSKKLISASMP